MKRAKSLEDGGIYGWKVGFMRKRRKGLILIFMVGLWQESQMHKGRKNIIILIIKNMDIEQTEDELINFMTNLSFNHNSHQKKSNTLIAAQMPSEVNPSHIEQYNVLYHDRLSKLGKRIKL